MDGEFYGQDGQDGQDGREEIRGVLSARIHIRGIIPMLLLCIATFTLSMRPRGLMLCEAVFVLQGGGSIFVCGFWGGGEGGERKWMRGLG